MKHRQDRRRSELIVVAIMALGIWTSACQSEHPPAAKGEVAGSWSAAVEARAKVVFTFDISSKTLLERQRPLFERHGMKAVVYAETAQLNSGESWVMSWDQLRDLQNVYGWEVASHTINHPFLTKVSDAQLESELKVARDDLVAHGLRITSFATPYGDYDLRVLAAIAKYYESHRAAWGGPNVWPGVYDDYRIRCYELSNTTTVAEARQWIDEAVRGGHTLVFLAHELVTDNPSEYEYREADLDQILDYVGESPIEVTTITDALRITSGQNLVGNPSFTSVSGGWASGWQRSNGANVTVDTAHHGNVSGPANSVRIVGAATEQRLTSGLVSVNGRTDYLLRIFHNVQDLSAGGWAVWIDEFAANGAWQSGQWLGGSYDSNVGYRYFEYAPSSAGIANVGITIYTEANSRMTLYIDDVSLKRVN